MKAPIFVPPYLKVDQLLWNWNPAVHQEQKLPASPDDTSKLIWSEIKLSVRLEFEMRDETPYSAKSETSNENKYMCAED